jgi:methylaspartate mutase sigma subunit
METGVKIKGNVVTGVIGDDVHVTGIRLLEHALSKAGFRVTALGVQVSQTEFVEAAIESKADAILVSSLSGHAKLSSQGLREKCIEAGLKDIYLYIGGNVGSGYSSWEEAEKTFENMGFDRVYPPFTLPGPVIADLEADLAAREEPHEG